MASKNYEKLVKVLQIASGVLMVGMVIACLVLMKVYNIKVQNIPQLAEMIPGEGVTLALIVIAFSVVKSFALVFPPAVVFSLCGYLFDNFWVALLVNIISVALSSSIPYALGKFTGAGMVSALKNKFKAVKKLDDFTGSNETMTTFVVKLSGLLPGDLSSLLFGAMGISYKKFMIGTNLGMLPLALAYTGFGFALKSVGEAPWLTAIPVVTIVVFVIISGIITKKMTSKSKQTKEK